MRNICIKINSYAVSDVLLCTHRMLHYYVGTGISFVELGGKGKKKSHLSVVGYCGW